MLLAKRLVFDTELDGINFRGSNSFSFTESLAPWGLSELAGYFILGSDESWTLFQ